MGSSECEDLFPLYDNCEPCLMQLPGRTEGKQELMNPYDHSIKEREIWQLKGKLCLGCFKDWFLLVDRRTKKTYFLHRTLNPKKKIRLPSLRNESLKHLGRCVLSSSPTSSKLMVTIVGRRTEFILYCRPKRETSWTKVSPSGLQENRVFTTQVVSMKGNIYIVHVGLHALQLVIINEDSLLRGYCRWTIVQMPTDTIPDRPLWDHLVVSGHDLFFVSIDTCAREVFPCTYTIHRWESSDQTWNRVESIGGCVFFLGGIHNAALSAAQAGTQGDCIYFANQIYSLLRGNGVYKICLLDKTVSFSLPLKTLTDLNFKYYASLCWVMPIKSRKSKRQTLSFYHSIETNKGDATYVHKEKKKEENYNIDTTRPSVDIPNESGDTTYVHQKYKNVKNYNIDTTRPWADIPIELVQLLLAQLYLVDCIRLPSVCKYWSSLSNPIEDAKVYPWLMCPMHDSSLWRFFDPVNEKEYYIDMNWLGSSKDLTLHYSKNGWVLASTEDNSLFLINPLTRESISLPRFDNCRCATMSFSVVPACLDFVVFVLLFPAHNVLEISTWSLGLQEWSRTIFNAEFESYVPCSPVFTHGEFYLYGKRGKLSVYNPKKKTLRDLEILEPLEIELFRARTECYFTELGGDLITVFRNYWKDPIRIFKLDQLNKVWHELDTIGDITLFLDHRTSIAKPSPEKRCRDMIYFSGFSDDNCKNSALYSLETKKYQPEIFHNLKQPLNCIWIEPNFDR